MLLSQWPKKGKKQQTVIFQSPLVAVWSQECWEFFYSFGNFDHRALLYLPKTVPLSLPGARLFLLFHLDFTKTGAAPHQSDLGLSEGKGHASPIRLEAPPKLKVIPPNSFRIPNPRVPVSFNVPQQQGQGLLSPLRAMAGSANLTSEISEPHRTK